MDVEETFTGDPLDRPVYGATKIGRVVNLTRNQAYHALVRGYLDADKFGRLWVSTPRRLKRFAAMSPDWQPRKPNSKEHAA
jgi:hypothetical protein